VVHAVALDRVRQGSHHVLLTYDLSEGLRAVAAVEGRLAGHRAESTGEPGAPRGRSAFCETGLVDSEDILDHGRRIAELERQVAELYNRLGQGEPPSASGLVFASDAAPSVTAGDDPRLLELIGSGQKIEAIKRYRELTGSGLAEAKDAVERIEAGR
jgi:ribosomal protein L7/L12